MRLAVESLAIGIDIGGTFTDMAMVSTAGEVYASKAPTTPVYRWTGLRPGQGVPGSTVIESEFTTVLVPPDVAARLDAYGNVVLSV